MSEESTRDAAWVPLTAGSSETTFRFEGLGDLGDGTLRSRADGINEAGLVIGRSEVPPPGCGGRLCWRGVGRHSRGSGHD